MMGKVCIWWKRYGVYVIATVLVLAWVALMWSIIGTICVLIWLP